MFQNFISLGVNYSVAHALAKYGLRSFSGPFDWCTSNFGQGVIPLMESDFAEFLSYGNLQVSEENEKVFDDVKYKINYNHDVKKSLEEEYADIYQKYQQRIARFREEIKSPTCFVRGCWSTEELSWIHDHEDQIISVIKKHPENKIIFVIPRFVYEQNPVKLKNLGGGVFLVETILSGYLLGREEGRGFFDTNPDLIDFCVKNYPSQKRKDNLIFDLKKELEIARKPKGDSFYAKEIERLQRCIIEGQENLNRAQQRNARWMRLLNTDFDTISFPEKICIYGCGAIGRIFYQKIREYCRVVEFIDKLPRQDFYHDIPVVTAKNSKPDREVEIVIVPSYDFQNIVDSLEKEYGFKPRAISLEEFLAQGKLIDPNF